MADATDERLAGYTGLTAGQRRDEWERRHGVFVAEGLLALEALVASPYRVRSLLTSRTRRERVAPIVKDLDAPWYEVEPSVINEVAGFDIHRGVLALGERTPPVDPGELLARPGHVVVTEAVNDHENLGAIFRNAAAFGATAVLGDPTTADPLYRRAVRVSLGHVLRVPWTRLAPWPGGLAAVQRSGRAIIALTPAADAPDLDAVAAELAGSPVAVLVGAEGPGLSDVALAAADKRARIPLAPGVDSLNVATALALALHALRAG